VNTVLSLIYIAYFFVCAAAYFPVAVVLSLLDKRLMHRATAFMTHRALMAFSPNWRCTISGIENLNGSGPYVIVANHQSLADIVVLYGLPLYFKWVSKPSIFWVPFLGWLMRLGDQISLCQGDLKSTRRMMVKCLAALRQGTSIIMFPEGTRSRDGRLQAFRDGPFRIAQMANVMLVPVVIDGTREVLPKGSINLNFCCHMRATVLPPVDPRCFGNDVSELRTYVRAEIGAVLSEMRAHPSQQEALQQNKERSLIKERSKP
jgi:1-acyl-sn-glycerol-3-phosphate acyltransferase